MSRQAELGLFSRTETSFVKTDRNWFLTVDTIIHIDVTGFFTVEDSRALILTLLRLTEPVDSMRWILPRKDTSYQRLATFLKSVLVECIGFLSD